MGYMRHHTIVVTSWQAEAIEAAHAQATKIFPWVSAISPEATNGYRSFFVPPDGSKEGWEDSDAGDNRRDAFIAWLEEAYKRRLWCTWVEVQFGDDDGVNKVTRTTQRE